MLEEDHTEYEITVQSAERRVFHLLHSIEWQLHSEKKNSSIHRMRCNITEDNIFRYEGIVAGRSPAEVAVLIHPEGPFRGKWDSQSAGTSVIARLREDTCIIRHDTKSRLMGLVSARDTIDLCRFNTDHVTGARTVVIVSVTHGLAPIREGVVRAHTHPTLLLIEPCGSDTKVTAILHAELHLMGIPTSVKDSFVPKGIANFFGDLNAFAAKDIKINLNQPLTGWIP